MSKLSYLILFIGVATVSGLRSYDGYKVYQIEPKNENEVNVLTEVQDSGIGEFWEDYFDVDHKVRIMVSGDKQGVFLGKMKDANIEVVETISDVEKAVRNQMRPAIARNASNSEPFYGLTWDRYHNLATINAWLDRLVAAYPDIVSSVVMGYSVENREIKGIRINYKPNRNNNTNYIGILEGTLHSREWICPATVTWIIKEFLTSTDPAVRAMAEDLDWHIFPVVNPDGYEYTFNTHRMWRKNRSPENFKSCAPYGEPDDMSHGVDLNRNFDFAWLSVGASNNSCSITYAGPTAFSEPESRAIAQYVLNLNQQGRLIYYLAFHSYTQLIVIPYSNVRGHEVLQNRNYADMYEIAKRGADAVSRRFGTSYRVGVAADVLYPMSGSSFDWVKLVTDIPVSYLVELRDMGEYGFLLPPEQIIPNNLEIMDGIIEMDRTTRILGYYSAGVANVLSVVLLAFSGLVCLLF
ncbi:zinc carboxypeptidase [Manduca sexta]|uniref:zinc carboxypeptidase n=1 Tax=Manduca sexta TaxID=7130 RepID=UPI00188FBDC0|nr:zinc carboxypeptidase [Manduca sexta]